MTFEKAKATIERVGYGEMQKGILGGSRFSFVFPIELNFFQVG